MRQCFPTCMKISCGELEDNKVHEPKPEKRPQREFKDHDDLSPKSRHLLTEVLLYYFEPRQ